MGTHWFLRYLFALVTCVGCHSGYAQINSPASEQLLAPLDTPALIQTTPTATPGPGHFKGPISARRPWKLCVVLPNVSDSFWNDIANGVRIESSRLGINSMIFEASGYTEAALKQQERILNQRCVNGSLDAVLIAAITKDGLNESLRRLRSQNVLVVDFVNGYSASEVDAHALLDNYHLGKTAGEAVRDYLPRLHPDHKGKWRILWVPGPQGPQWVERADLGFREALKPINSTLELDSLYLQPHYRVQAREIRKQLEANKTYDMIVGTGPTSLAAQQLKKDGVLPANTPVFAYYATPDALALLAAGQLVNAVTNEPELLGRMGVALAVGMLEKKPMPYQVGPLPHLVQPLTTQ